MHAFCIRILFLEKKNRTSHATLNRMRAKRNVILQNCMLEAFTTEY